jgi:hypothetical protein
MITILAAQRLAPAPGPEQYFRHDIVVPNLDAGKYRSEPTTMVTATELATSHLTAAAKHFPLDARIETAGRAVAGGGTEREVRSATGQVLGWVTTR